MELRVGVLDLPENLQVPLQPRIGVVGGDNVHLRDPPLGNILDDAEDLLVAHRIGIGILAAGTVGAELADVLADVRRVDVAVDVEIGLLPVQCLAAYIRQFAQVKKIQVIQRKRLVEADALARPDFFYDIHA
jgi:hypothetical protein